MTLKLIGTREVGNVQRERIVLSATTDLDIGSYIVAAIGDAESGILTLGHNIWLPNKMVKRRDLVVVYTKKGKTKVKENSSGRTTHFFYLNQDKALWDEFLLTLINVKEWSYEDPAPDVADELEPK